MISTYRIAASRNLKASPSAIFRIVTDPHMHVEIDGSGMLQAAPNARRLESVGDVFEMDMDRESLGDIPIGKYKVYNTVTRIVPDALIEWNVRVPEREAPGHVYGWEIAALGADETEVTNYCDWSNAPDELQRRFPIVPMAMMEQSVENLVAIVAQESQPPD